MAVDGIDYTDLVWTGIYKESCFVGQAENPNASNLGKFSARFALIFILSSLFANVLLWPWFVTGTKHIYAGMWMRNQFSWWQKASRGLSVCWQPLCWEAEDIAECQAWGQAPTGPRLAVQPCADWGLWSVLSPPVASSASNKFVSPRDLSSAPILAKIMNVSTEPFRLKMWFLKIFVKCSFIPWEKLQCIFPIHICKITLNVCIYFY